MIRKKEEDHVLAYERALARYLDQCIYNATRATLFAEKRENNSKAESERIHNSGTEFIKELKNIRMKYFKGIPNAIEREPEGRDD